MLRTFLKFVFCFFCFSLYINCPLLATDSLQSPPFSLHQKFLNGKAGDYIVTAQLGHYTLLFIQSLTSDTLVLEEITIPEKLINLKEIDWQLWLDQQAVGHTSWMLYTFDRQKGSLIACFSYSNKGWIYLTQEEQFLSQLLHLPLHLVSKEERKKIGPAPERDELDRRPVWVPPVIINGKKISKPSIEVFSTKWPDDRSPLSSCTIELYFNKDDPSFAFPYWIEVKTPHYAFKMRGIDSGKALRSAVPEAVLSYNKKKSQVMNNFSPTPSSIEQKTTRLE